MKTSSFHNCSPSRDHLLNPYVEILVSETLREPKRDCAIHQSAKTGNELRVESPVIQINSRKKNHLFFTI